MGLLMFSRLHVRRCGRRRSRLQREKQEREQKREGECGKRREWNAGRRRRTAAMNRRRGRQGENQVQVQGLWCRGGQKPSGGGLWQVGSCSCLAPARLSLSLPLPPPHPQSHPASPRSDRLHPLGESHCPRMRQATTYCAQFPILTGFAPSRGRRVA